MSAPETAAAAKVGDVIGYRRVGEDALRLPDGTVATVPLYERAEGAPGPASLYWLDRIARHVADGFRDGQ